MPQFTPMELKLRIKRIPNHNELGVGFTTKERSNVETPPYVELQPRRTLSEFMEASSASSSSTAAPAPSATPDAAPAPAPAPSNAAPPPPSLPPIDSLSTAPIKTQIAVLDTLFERSTELHTLVLPTLRRKRTPTADSSAGGPGPATSEADHESPLSSYTSLIRHVGSLLASLASQSASFGTTPSPQQQKLHGILGSHPRLGAKKVESAQSQAEQAQLNQGGAEEAEKLKALNDEYEQRFPGLRYVVFVNGRSRPVVMEDMRRRIDRGDPKEEEQEAIKAMVDIALDRAKKLNAVD
ncbi:OHCU decarboxylase [Apiospora hydei]|uniref:OHCU decarboxylase n=1 Tax=Apiospora hydei TaxID=1337664 RepID=A0ABR1V3K2_9PEZI